MQFSQRGKLKLHGKLQNAGPVRSTGGAELGFTFPAEVSAGQLPTGGTTPLATLSPGTAVSLRFPRCHSKV